MKREFIHITDNNKHRLMSDSGFWHGSTNENSRDKMKKILSMAVLNELTERQRRLQKSWESTRQRFPVTL